MVEIPDEKTPLDRFISLDEDHLNSVRKIQRERDEAIKKLDKYLSSTVGARLVKVFDMLTSFLLLSGSKLGKCDRFQYR